ncbi:MAG: protein-glutamate methylesterase/protein-glutamine glutaminase [Eubacteriales bacterium]
MPIKLLVVDDSAFMRKIISDLVKDIDGIEIIGVARNGLDALNSIPKLKPDIITLDIEMPKLNGIDALREIKRNYNIPVIMLSSHSGSDITMEALQIGAVDFIEKPTDLNTDLIELKNELKIKITTVFSCNLKTSVIQPFAGDLPHHQVVNKAKAIDAVVIGASTGGPKALFNIISKIPKEFKIPIFIVQHMPKGFTTSFASRLNDECSIPVVEAQDKMIYHKGMIYVAPGDYHMTIDKSKIRLNTKDKMYGVRPAVDYLFYSASEVFRDKLLGIILTGMGRDGTNGMAAIKENGGYNLVQNEETCVVYGMPGSAVSKGVVHEILSLNEISNRLNRNI